MAASMEGMDDGPEDDEIDEEIDVLSPNFNPLKALYSSQVRLPITDASCFNNLSEYERFMNTGGEKPAPPTTSKRALERMHQKYILEKEKELLKARGDRRKRTRQNVLSRMEDPQQGPLDLLKQCVEKHCRVRVCVRSFKGLRSVCIGYVIAYDKMFNMALKDVDEIYKRPSTGKRYHHEEKLTYSMIMANLNPPKKEAGPCKKTYTKDKPKAEKKPCQLCRIMRETIMEERLREAKSSPGGDARRDSVDESKEDSTSDSVDDDSSDDVQISRVDQQQLLRDTPSEAGPTGHHQTVVSKTTERSKKPVATAADSKDGRTASVQTGMSSEDSSLAGAVSQDSEIKGDSSVVQTCDTNSDLMKNKLDTATNVLAATNSAILAKSSQISSINSSGTNLTPSGTAKPKEGNTADGSALQDVCATTDLIHSAPGVEVPGTIADGIKMLRRSGTLPSAITTTHTSSTCTSSTSSAVVSSMSSSTHTPQSSGSLSSQFSSALTLGARDSSDCTAQRCKSKGKRSRKGKGTRKGVHLDPESGKRLIQPEEFKRRHVNQLFVRGDNVVLISVDSNMITREVKSLDLHKSL
ncbi:uncharacterized protein [Diadema setosum]|uniref:uncharacterized protein n=1 Tax=Diadema setosum TaxID=31175 RepID=UPI003B3AD0A8